jgi:hypothetical protein
MNKSFFCFASALGFLVTFSNIVSAGIINFDTRQNGTPYSGLVSSFSATEYTGVTITDSDPTAGITFVNLTNPLNVGTPISGYYLNLGVFAGIVPTRVTLNFSVPTTFVGFDFAKPIGALNVRVFDTGGTLLDNSSYATTSSFISQAGFTSEAGQIAIAAFNNIGRVEIEPGANQGLIIDNLNFKQASVPVPAPIALLCTGLLSLGFVSRRKSSEV